MEVFYSVAVGFLDLLLDVLLGAFLLRAVFSWFDQTGEGGFSAFLYALTEPIIFPIRALFEAKEWFEDSVIDVPYFVTMILLSLLRTGMELFL